MLRLLALVAVTLFASSLGSTRGHAERYALIVGINKYSSKGINLEKAVNDAQRIKSALQARAFKAQNIKLLLDEKATRQQILKAWEELTAKANQDDVVLFFFAGHGLQKKGTSYIVPHDVPIARARFFEEAGISLRAMLDSLTSNRQGPGLTLFIVDACRDNPWGALQLPEKQTAATASTRTTPAAVAMNSTAERSGPLDRAMVVPGESRTRSGPGPMLPPRNVFIMYSAGIGQKALDGERDNSVYTTELLKYIDRTDWSLAEIAQEIRYTVYREAGKIKPGHLQTPAYYDQLPGRLNLLGNRPTSDARKFIAPAKGELTPPPPLAKLAHGDIIMEYRGLPEVTVIKRDELNTAPYAIGRYEVTNGEWNSFVSSSECRAENQLATVRREGANRKPVTGVSFYEAEAYTRWLSCLTGANYRLPSIIEWQFAARGSATGNYSFCAKNKACKLADLCRFANGADRSMRSLFFTNNECSDGSGRGVTPTGSYLPNGYGLFDVHGNVWEWLSDCQRTRDDTTCQLRAARGGSWRSTAASMRLGVRQAFPPALKKSTVGFRVLRELE